jgi:Mn2+/Fe2+ NRAMP family transporter
MIHDAGAMVLGMAILFLSVAANVAPPAVQFAEGLLPTVPGGSIFTVVALVGATISLASLFLSSAIAKVKMGLFCRTFFGPVSFVSDRIDFFFRKGQSIDDLRTGIASSMTAGGIISIIIMVAGTGVEREDDDDDFGIIDLINLFKDQVGQSSAVD